MKSFQIYLFIFSVSDFDFDDEINDLPLSDFVIDNVHGAKALEPKDLFLSFPL